MSHIMKDTNALLNEKQTTLSWNIILKPLNKEMGSEHLFLIVKSKTFTYP